MESEGIRYRFFADLLDLDSTGGVEQTLRNEKPFGQAAQSYGRVEARTFVESFTLPALPGVASFFVRGTKLDLPQGFRTVWKTRSLTP